ncbi:hypothetical protein LTR17_013386 [Elasticomyces elasticus]|nr:hypothetical protein LTR17_013386 [Elasticomyces elasticus]
MASLSINAMIAIAILRFDLEREKSKPKAEDMYMQQLHRRLPSPIRAMPFHLHLRTHHIQIFSDRSCQSQIGDNIVFLWDSALAAGRQELVDLGPFQSIQFFEGTEAQPGAFVACQEGFDCFTDGQNAPIAQDVIECSVLTGDQFDKIGVVPDRLV